MSFRFIKHSEIPEIIMVKSQCFEDNRGFYSEYFRENKFEQAGIPPFVQENHSHSVSGVFRGLHYQLKPYEQGKLVYCVSGYVRDFAVDIRQGSPTYGEHVAVDLGEEIRMVYIPPGFAHGFKSYGKPDAEIIYKVTNYYAPDYERAIRWNDPVIGINLIQRGLKISEKDRVAPLLVDAENNFVYEEME